MADAPRTGDSGLLVPIPEAEALVGELRLRHDPIASDGVPAHVTVLFPFVPRAQIGREVREGLGEVFAAQSSFDYRFERTGRFGDTTVFMEPEPADAFLTLIRAAAARWPEHPPYGGAFEVVIPHLTVGDDLADGEADLLITRLQEILDRSGPITGRAAAVTLMTGDQAGRWTTDSVYPLDRGREARD